MLTAFASEFGLDTETAFKIAAPFGGGLARRGYTCGVVTGGLMVLGLKHGYTSPEGRDATYAIADEFMQRFKESHGYLACRDLIGYDISSPESRRLAQESGVFQSICPKLVDDAVELVTQLLNQ